MPENLLDTIEKFYYLPWENMSLFGDMFSPKPSRNLSRASTMGDLSQAGTEGDEQELDPQPSAQRPKVNERVSSSSFEFLQEEGLRKLQGRPLGDLLLPILTALYACAERVGQVQTPDLDLIANLVTEVEKAVGNENILPNTSASDPRQLQKLMMEGLYVAPVERENLVSPPDPSFFATTDYLDPTKPQRLNVIKYMFPVNQFSGHNDKISIEQFLSIMTDGCERMKGKLSESDFRTILLSKTTGRCHESLRTWSRNRLMPLPLIFSKLLGMYDQREGPVEAKEKLDRLESTFFSSLSSMLLRVETLARRSALCVKGESNQEVLFNLHGCQALERLVPEPFKSNATSMKLQLEQVGGESLDFQSFSSILDKWDRQISAVLREKYIPRNGKKGKWAANASANSATAAAAAASLLQSDEGGGKGSGKREGKQGGQKEGSNAGQGGRNKGKNDSDAGKKSSSHGHMHASDSGTPYVRANWKTPGTEKSPDSYITPNNEGTCIKCHGNHPTKNCVNVAGPPAKYSCRKCDTNAHHFEMYCPFAAFHQQQKSNEGRGQKMQSDSGPKGKPSS